MEHSDELLLAFLKILLLGQSKELIHLLEERYSATYLDLKYVDPERLRQAVMDDLMQEQLMSWLETNSTLTEKAPEPESDTKS